MSAPVEKDHGLVVLCIATFKRPEGLRKLLDSVAALAWDQELRVVVADNDPAGAEGVSLCESLRDDFPWPLEAIVVSEAGIPFPRNAAIARALELDAKLLAFLDDDEWVMPTWLEEMTSVLDLGADLAGGPQRPVFPTDAPDAARSNPYYGHDQELRSGEECLLQSSGNFITTAAALAPHGPPWFDPKYARTSGADHDLFRRMELSGATMRWAPRAFVWEDVPAHRLGDAWMRERVTEIHNGRVRIDRSHQPGFRYKVVRGFKTVALSVQTLAVSLMALRDRERSHEAQLLRWKLRGKVDAHLGRVIHRKEDRPQ